MITRRRFLAGSIATAVGSVIPHELFAKSAQNTRVVIVTDENAVSGSTVYPDIVRQMVNAGIKQLTGQPTIGQAWYSLLPGITSSSKVSIKLNLSDGYNQGGWPKTIVQSATSNGVVAGLQQMPVASGSFPAENILLWDLDRGSIVAAGYPINWGGAGVQVYYAVQNYNTWKPDGNWGNGLGFDSNYVCLIDHPAPVTDTTHKPTKIITQHTDYMLNIGVLKKHSSAGAVGVLKNHYGSFTNIALIQMHYSYGHDCTIEGICRLNEFIRDDLGKAERLFMIDGLFGSCTSGPNTSVDCTPKLIILGTDPVAVDHMMVTKLNDERVAMGLLPLDPYPPHVAAAAGAPFNLGTNNPANIDLVYVTNPSVPPAQVQNVRATSAGSDVVITWDAVAGVSNYNVYRHSTAYPQAPGILIGSTVGTAFTHVGVGSEPFGFYKVTAEY